MKFVPLVHVENTYIGAGKASLQMKIVSAVVTYIAARNTVTRQTETINNILKVNPNAKDTLAEQIAKLTMERQNLLLNTLPKTDPMAGGVQGLEPRACQRLGLNQVSEQL